MKNEIQLMTIPKIKRLLRFRELSMVLSILFTASMVGFLFGNRVMHLPWGWSLLLVTTCGGLALVCWGGYLFFKHKLASGGL